MNKSAQEMFEELGYALKKDETCLTYEREDCEEIYFVFYDYTQEIGVGSYNISVDELKAINKQCEELGWLE